MDRLLLVLCLLWLVVLGEDLNVSLSNDRLRRFPISVRSLLALKLSSLFLPPPVWLVTSVSAAWPLSPSLCAPSPARQPGGALLLCAHHWCRRECVSAARYRSPEKKAPLRRRGAWRRGARVRASLAAARCQSAERESHRCEPGNLGHDRRSRDHTVSDDRSSCDLARQRCRWSGLYCFGASPEASTTMRAERTAHRATSIAWLPGRLGPLVQKEQRSIRTVLDLWMGLATGAGSRRASALDFAVIDGSPDDLRDCLRSERQRDAELSWPGPTRRADAIPHSSDSWEGSLPGKERGRDGPCGPAVDGSPGDWRMAVWRQTTRSGHRGGDRVAPGALRVGQRCVGLRASQGRTTQVRAERRSSDIVGERADRQRSGSGGDRRTPVRFARHSVGDRRDRPVDTCSPTTARCDMPEGVSSVESSSSAAVWDDRREGPGSAHESHGRESVYNRVDPAPRGPVSSSAD